MGSNAILEWQKRFRAAPRVWEVLENNESTGQMYDSEEAADVHVEWLRARKRRGRAVYYNLHSLELSRERWQPASVGQAGTRGDAK